MNNSQGLSLQNLTRHDPGQTFMCRVLMFQVWNILSGKPGPVQRVQVQRRVLGLTLPMFARRLQLDNSIAIADVEAFDRRI